MSDAATSRRGDADLMLRSVYHRRPREDLEPEPQWYGTFDLQLEGPALHSWAPGTRLAVWCQTVLTPGPATNAAVVDRFTGHVVLEPLDAVTLADGGVWRIDGVRSRYPARHANDGPEAAYVIEPDGRTRPVTVIPATTSHVSDRDGSPAVDARPTEPAVDDGRPALVPYPRRLVVGGPCQQVRVRFESPVAAPIAELAARLGVDAVTHDGEPDDGRLPTVAVDVTIDPAATDAGEARITRRGERCEVVAADDAAARLALITLAQLAADPGGLPSEIDVADRPAHRFRGLHVDLARRWYEPDVVTRLIDVAAWRKLSHVHLHLTDDEAWRFPVPEYQTLATVGGTRGHGLAVPPVCASGAGPYGRAYTSDEIGAWVRRARELGVVLVPEVDVPGHCFAALAAVPSLRDPDDTSGAVSVQGFVDNVLVPGHPETERFLRAVFGALADLFPDSPVLHIGGDEVPAGAWSGSPLAHAYARSRGLTTTAAIEAQFHRELIELIRETTGRDVAAWEEVGVSGVAPGAYAVAWTSPEAGRRLADAGHRVVMAPGQAYYLDMAAQRRWESPGATWAGTVSLEDTCAFEPALDGVEIAGVQACLWSEHVASLAILDELMFPRLDAIAERGWRGDIVGGAASLARRAASQPRVTDGPPGPDPEGPVGPPGPDPEGPAHR